MTAVAVDDAATMTSISKMLREPIFRCLLQSVRGCRQTAEDLVQETMLRAWRSFAAMPEEGESRRRWMFTIARNVAIDADRVGKRRPDECVGLDPTLFGTDIANPDRVAIRHGLREAVAELPLIHREVVIELYFEDRPVAEVAKRLGIPEGTVKSRAHYALRALRTTLATT